MRYVSVPHAYPENTGRRPATIMLALALVAALGGCTDRSAGSTKPAEFVRTLVVRPEQNQGSVTLTGQLQARFQAQLSFRVSGRVVARFVDVGAHVDAGQLLATIDPAEQQADVDAASAAVVAADFRSRIAKTTFDRQNTLLADGFTTRVAFDQAQEELRNAESSLEAANAQLGTAKDYLGYTELRAGVAGIITERRLEIGQVVQAAQPVFTLAQDGERDAVFDVSESMLLRDVDGSAVSLALVSDPSIAAIGHVREVSPAVDQRSLTIRVKVTIENAPAAMTLGSAVAGTARLKPAAQITLPWTALMATGSKPAVWVVDPATATVAMRPVTIANHEAGLVVIEQGLQPGDCVVVDGGKLLSSGQYVRYDKDPS
jgi:membrane fusion protein, multidrug efflux system